MFITIYHIILCLSFILLPHKSFSIDINSLTLLNELKIDPVIQYSNIYDNLISLFYETSNINIAYTEQFITCNTYITELIEEQPNGANANQLYHIFDFSGKQSGELGQESECLRSDLKYFLLLFNISVSRTKEISEDANSIAFLNPSRSFIGMCIPGICLDFAMTLFNTTLINAKLTDYLYDSFGIIGTEVMLDFSLNTSVTDSRIRSSAFSEVSFFVLSSISILFFGIMVICSIGKIIVFLLFQYDKGMTRKKRKIGLLANENDEYYSDEYETIENQKLKYNDGLLFGKKTIRLDKLSKSQKTKLKIFNLLSKLDFVYNFQCLFSMKNKYYNDNGIELFAFLRIILMFFLLYNQNIYTLLELPGKDQYNENFYSSWLFFIVKTSSYSTVCWIVLDGAEFAYKLMNYSKKYLLKKTKQTVPITVYLKFMLFSIPKIMQVLFIYLYFYLLNQNFSSVINLGLLFDYFSGYILNQRECWRKPHTIFLPFIFNYINYKDRSYTNCYRFTNLFTNELYFIIILSLVVYISFKLRSKIFDLCVLLLVIGNSILVFLSYYSYDLIKNKVDIDLLFTFGQNYTEKFPHLFINVYMIGFYIGICYFYFHDAVLEDSLRQLEGQLPFQFCFSLIGYLDKMKNKKKKILLAVCICFIILLSFSPFISSSIEGSYLHSINYFDIIFDIYGKNLFAFTFGIIIIFLIIYPKDSILKNIIQTNIFVPFERISTAFFCMEDLIVYVIYCVFHFQLKLTYQNLFVLSIGLLLISLFVCIFITICIEMNVRKFIKFLLRDENEGEEDEINEEESGKLINEKEGQNNLNIDGNK